MQCNVPQRNVGEVYDIDMFNVQLISRLTNSSNKKKKKKKKNDNNNIVMMIIVNMDMIS